MFLRVPERIKTKTRDLGEPRVLLNLFGFNKRQRRRRLLRRLPDERLVKRFLTLQVYFNGLIGQVKPPF
jgi:hypothetical protein